MAAAGLQTFRVGLAENGALRVRMEVHVGGSLQLATLNHPAHACAEWNTPHLLYLVRGGWLDGCLPGRGLPGCFPGRELAGCAAWSGAT